MGDVLDEPLEACNHGDVIIGWRCWEVWPSNGLRRDHDGVWRRCDKPSLRLVSWARDTEWTPLVEYDALRNAPECVKAGHPKLKSIADCQCGIHAFKSKVACLIDLRAEFTGRNKYALVAMGRVSLWGRYVEAQQGWRARYAYPYDVKLLNCDDPAVARELADTYAVDVTYGMWDWDVEMGGGWDCLSDGHRWNNTLSCGQCGLTLQEYERIVAKQRLATFGDEITAVIGDIPSSFSDKTDALRWFNDTVSEIEKLDDPRTNEVIRILVGVVRPYLRRNNVVHNPAVHSSANGHIRAAVSWATSLPPSLQERTTFRMPPPSSTATNKRLPPSR